MNRCPLTYKPCGSDKFSQEGLRKISPKLLRLQDLPFDAQGLRLEAMSRAGRLSIQGVQPKISAVLSIKKSSFELVDINGRFILKPQTDFPELPQNEDLTMHLAHISGLNVPLHGLIYAKDQSLVYFIKRFDRQGRSKKIHTEDFAQLSGANRQTKYNSSMEKLVSLIETFCTFPMVEKAELFRRTIFNYLVGNEDMHLKNFSIITLDGVNRMAPVYDFVNSTIVLKNPEEIALPLNGKKRGLNRKAFVTYFGQERLGLEPKVIEEILENYARILHQWFEWIDRSFLSSLYKEKYQQVVQDRAAKLDILDPKTSLL